MLSQVDQRVLVFWEKSNKLSICILPNRLKHKGIYTYSDICWEFSMCWHVCCTYTFSISELTIGMTNASLSDDGDPLNLIIMCVFWWRMAICSDRSHGINLTSICNCKYIRSLANNLPSLFAIRRKHVPVTDIGRRNCLLLLTICRWSCVIFGEASIIQPDVKHDWGERGWGVDCVGGLWDFDQDKSCGPEHGLVFVLLSKMNTRTDLERPRARVLTEVVISNTMWAVGHKPTNSRV